MSRRPPSFRDHPLRTRLLSLYKEADGLLSDFSCDGSTECCQFAVNNREPYPTAIERAEVERAVRSLGWRPGEVSSRGVRRLPMADEQGRCPLLDEGGKCRIYGARPFGCRTYFCDRARGPGKVPRSEITALSRRIADLSAEYEPRDPGPRPLTRFLEAMAGGRR